MPDSPAHRMLSRAQRGRDPLAEYRAIVDPESVRRRKTLRQIRYLVLAVILVAIASVTVMVLRRMGAA